MSAPELNWREVFEGSENSERHLQQASVFNVDPLTFFQEIFFVLWIIFALISLILFAILQYIKLKIKKQREKEAAFFASQKRSEIAMRLYGDSKEQTIANTPSGVDATVARSKDRWIKIQKLYKSDKPSDKKLAILEADLLLKDMLLTLGYENDSLGRMLKSMDKKDFPLLEEAWEAHKIRNELAHSSLQECDLTLVARAMYLYKRIFRRFDFI